MTPVSETSSGTRNEQQRLEYYTGPSLHQQHPRASSSFPPGRQSLIFLVAENLLRDEVASFRPKQDEKGWTGLDLQNFNNS